MIKIKKKSESTTDTLKRKIEQNEAEHEIKLKTLIDEREELKKEIKSLTKKEGGGAEGKVNKEALSKVTNELQIEVDRTRKEIDEERKSKSVSETTKRNLEVQMTTLKDQFEQEERLKKKITLQKKQIQSEIDELKELAEESEELQEEIEKFKLESDSFQTELKNDIQREKNSRIAADQSLSKLQRELQDIKKSLDETKANDELTIKKN